MGTSYKTPLVIDRGAKDRMFCTGYRGAIVALAPSVLSPREGFRIRTSRVSRKMTRPVPAPPRGPEMSTKSTRTSQLTGETTARGKIKTLVPEEIDAEIH